MREKFDMSSTRYYQVLNALIDRPEALEADQAALEQAEVQPDGTVGKESDRPDTTAEDSTELAAGDLTADQAQSGPWALFAALAAMVLAGIAGLILFLARRTRDEEATTTA